MTEGPTDKITLVLTVRRQKEEEEETDDELLDGSRRRVNAARELEEESADDWQFARRKALRAKNFETIKPNLNLNHVCVDYFFYKAKQLVNYDVEYLVE